MLNISKNNVDRVKLELTWGFPKPRSVDFLDGSCLIYSSTKLLEVVDFRGAHSKFYNGINDSQSSDESNSDSANETSDSDEDNELINNINRLNHERSALWRRQRVRQRIPKYRYTNNFWRKLLSSSEEEEAADAIQNSIKHSGDLIYMNSNSGQHIINIKLSKLPKLVTDIVFALSAYNCGMLNLFKSQKIRLLNGLNPLHELCPRYSIANCKSEAVIMCSLRRGRHGWTLMTGGNTDATGRGTIRDYRPIDQLTFPTLVYHNRWLRRKELILLWTLVKYRRAKLDKEEDGLIHRPGETLDPHKSKVVHTMLQYFLRLPSELAMKVIMYL